MQNNTQSVKDIKSTEKTITVSRTMWGQTTEESSHIAIRPFATTPAAVTVSYGRTINLGNYESAKVNVEIKVPCYVEEIRDVYKLTSEQVAQLMDAEVDKITGKTKVGVTKDVNVEELL